MTAVRPVEFTAAGGRVGGGTQGRQGAQLDVLYGPEVNDPGGWADQQPQRPRAVLEQGGARHARLGGERRDAASCRGEAAVELVGEEQVGQLGLAVRGGP